MYFSLRCFEAETTKKILIVLNIVLAGLGVIHWACTSSSIQISASLMPCSISIKTHLWVFLLVFHK